MTFHSSSVRRYAFCGLIGLLAMAAPQSGLASVPLASLDAVCAPSSTSLCLNHQRFHLEVDWKDFTGNTGVGKAVPLTSDTGYFWFFSNSNVELTVKVLDARGLNGHFWVFFGALTNVEYTLRVTDSQTGNVKVYFNPSGRFGSVGDTAAFSANGTPTQQYVETDEASMPSGSFSESIAIARNSLIETLNTTCAGTETSLCLNGERFRVEANWKDFQGNTGVGQAISLTSDTGYFWFFDKSNVELVVKVLDARSFNNRFWVFYGALSNVEYEIKVTDTTNGDVRRYRNPSGRFASVGDTASFPPDRAPLSTTARALAERVSQATNNEERREALLDVMRALHVGVYTSNGEVVVRGAERAAGDFYLYDFEVQLMSQSLERRDIWTIPSLTAFVNEMGILREGVKLQSEDLKQALLRGTRSAVQDPDDPGSLAALLVRELGLRQPTPHDAAVSMDIQSTRFDALQNFLILADLTLPIVQETGPVTVASRLATNSGGILRQRELPHTVCEEIAKEIQDTWSIGQYFAEVEAILSPGAKLALAIIDGLHGALIAYSVEVKELDTVVTTHYGHESPGDELHFRIAVNMLDDLPEIVTCGWLPGLELPKKGPIGGVSVVWLHDLEKHGEVRCPILACTTSTAADGVATLVFKPKTEANPGAGTQIEDTGLVEGIALTQWHFGNYLGTVSEVLVPKSASTRWKVEYHEDAYELAFDSFINGTSGFLATSRALATVPLRFEDGKGYTGSADLNYRTDAQPGCAGYQYSGSGSTKLNVLGGHITPPAVPGAAPAIELTIRAGPTDESCIVRNCLHGDQPCGATRLPLGFWTYFFYAARGVVSFELAIKDWTFVGTNDVYAQKILTSNCSGFCNETTKLILRRRLPGGN